MFKPQVIIYFGEKEEEEEEKVPEEVKVKSKRGCKKKREGKKPERIFQSVYLKRELKTPRENILNKHKTRRVEQNKELSMVANVVSIEE